MIIHIIPESPTRSQSFVFADIRQSFSVTESIVVVPLKGDQKYSIVGNNLSFPVLRNFVCLIFNKDVWTIYKSQEEKTLRRFVKTFLSAIIASQIAERVQKTISSEIIILHAHFISTGLEIANFIKILEPKVILFATAHGSDVYFNSNSRLIKLTRNLNALICASNSLKEHMKKVYGGCDQKAPRIIVRYCRVENFFKEVKFAEKADSPFQIITIARYHPQKGLIRSLEVARELDKLNFDFRWTFIGDGPQRSKLEKLIQEWDLSTKVKLAGFMTHSKTLDALASSDLMVLLSVVADRASDGLPVSILEAMAAQVLVLSTEIGGIPEALGEGRGILVNPFAAEIAKQISFIQTKKDIYEQTKDEARKWITKHCLMNTKDPNVGLYMEFHNS